MKILLSFIFLTFPASFLCLGQTIPVEKWTRIDLEKGEVSIAVPPDVIIDADRHDDGQVFRVVAYRNGLTIDMNIHKTSDGKNRIQRISPKSDEEGYSFTINKIEGKQLSASKPRGRYLKRIFLASGNRFYSLIVESPSIKTDDLVRFRNSILVRGRPLFERNVTASLPEETVSDASLRTSPEVREAFARRSGKQEIDIKYREISKFVEPQEPLSVRPAIVVDRPYPNMGSMIRPSFGTQEQMSAKLVIHYLANGEIGDIVVPAIITGPVK